MKLQNLCTNKMLKIINDKIISKEIFNGYKAVEYNAYKISSPTIIVMYDYIYINENADRWMFINIEMHSNYIKLKIELNKLLLKEPSNLNIENYFIENYKNKSISKLMSFTIKSEEDLKECLEKIFVYIDKNSDKILQEIFRGKHWRKQKFDWYDYR